jgi:hypothetical protein
MRLIGVLLGWVSVGFNVFDLRLFVEWELFRGYFFSFIFLLLVD